MRKRPVRTAPPTGGEDGASGAIAEGPTAVDLAAVTAGEVVAVAAAARAERRY
jgi:hypothetical protein